MSMDCPLNLTNYVRNARLRTLWGLGKNAHMTIKPIFITKQFSSAILYSTHCIFHAAAGIARRGRKAPRYDRRARAAGRDAGLA